MALAIVLAGAGGCRQGTSTLALDLSLEPSDLPVRTVQVEVRSRQRAIVERDFTWEADRRQIGLFLPGDITGEVHALGRGLDADGRVIASGEARTSVKPGTVADPVPLVLTATLAPPTQDGGPDADPGPDGGADAADAGPDGPRPDGAGDAADAPAADRSIDTGLDVPADLGVDQAVVVDRPADLAVDLAPDLAVDKAVPPDTAPPPCGPADGQCPAACAGARDPDCKRDLGAACTAKADCRSGFCADGRCCNDACAAPCQSCSAAGACSTVKDGPDLECAAPQTCDDTGACVSAPATAPVALRPFNGESTGSVFQAAALRPRFLWKSVPSTTRYELQVDDSCAVPGFATCAFPSPELNTTAKDNSYLPTASLPVSLTAPVGRRYFWRVRACNGAGCSGWSEVRYVEVGRQVKDLNGDGYADALFAGNSGLHVVLGGASIRSMPDFSIEDPQTTFLSVAAVGDVNADGFGDFVAGLRNNGQFARLYLGAAKLDGMADQTFHLSPMNVPDYGKAVSGGGDFDGDGFADLAVVASGDETTGSHAYYYRGGKTIGFNPAITFDLPDKMDLAVGVDLTGDYNGDGAADLLVATHSRAYMYLGGQFMGNGGPEAQYPNNGVVGVGDVNGDGYGDFLLTGNSPRLFRGGENFGGNPALTLDKNGDAAGAGDINGDGYTDVVVGVWGDKAYVYWGGDAMDGRADVSLLGDSATESFAAAVSVVGDVRGDGFGAVSVGAPDNATVNYAAGRVYLFYGGAPLNGQPDKIINGSVSEQIWGFAVAMLHPHPWVARPRGGRW